MNSPAPLGCGSRRPPHPATPDSDSSGCNNSAATAVRPHLVPGSTPNTEGCKVGEKDHAPQSGCGPCCPGPSLEIIPVVDPEMLTESPKVNLKPTRSLSHSEGGVGASPTSPPISPSSGSQPPPHSPPFSLTPLCTFSKQRAKPLIFIPVLQTLRSLPLHLLEFSFLL